MSIAERISQPLVAGEKLSREEFLRRWEYGGQSGVERGLGKGAPELIVEVSHSSASYDLGPKLRLCRAAGVQEYITVLLAESKVIWRRLVAGAYVTIEPARTACCARVSFPACGSILTPC